jgi:hypothetical protein
MKPDATTSSRLVQYAALQAGLEDRLPIICFFLDINPTITAGPSKTNTKRTIMSIAKLNKFGNTMGTMRAGNDSNK